MATIRPLPGYCLVEPIEDDGKTTGGVYLPEISKDKPMKGKVISVGGPVTRDGRLYVAPPNLSKGDVVIHKKWVNETVSSQGKEILFVRFEDLLGVEE